MTSKSEYPNADHLRATIKKLIKCNWWPKKDIIDWSEDDLTIIKLLLRIEKCTDADMEIFEIWIRDDTQNFIDAGIDIPVRVEHDDANNILIDSLTTMYENGERLFV